MKQRQLLYAFNFYVPKAYLMPAANSSTADGAPTTSLRYPASFACCDVYTDDHVCKASSGKAGCLRPIRVDGSFLRTELQKAVAFRDKYSVPVLLDQVRSQPCVEHDLAQCSLQHNSRPTFMTLCVGGTCAC
jgi:hypothetical protein